MYRLGKYIINSVATICISLLVASCGADDAQIDAVARVYDNYLSRSELRRAIPYGLSTQDSAAFANDYIQQWIQQNLVLHRAEMNLRDEEKDVSKQLEDYRTSLVIFAYETELVKQKLDTVVTDAEIEAYYNANSANFELKSNIVRLRYIKLPINTPNADKAKRWLGSKKQDDLDKLEQFARLYAVNSLLDDRNWLLLDDVVKEIPLTESLVNANKGSGILELNDKEYHYLVALSGVMVKDSRAPLAFEKNTIKNIILNKRKIVLIEKMQQDAYKDALNEKDIEFYFKK
jgi:hypothetical protein